MPSGNLAYNAAIARLATAIPLPPRFTVVDPAHEGALAFVGRVAVALPLSAVPRVECGAAGALLRLVTTSSATVGRPRWAVARPADDARPEAINVPRAGPLTGCGDKDASVHQLVKSADQLLNY